MAQRQVQFMKKMVQEENSDSESPSVRIENIENGDEAETLKIPTRKKGKRIWSILKVWCSPRDLLNILLFCVVLYCGFFALRYLHFRRRMNKIGSPHPPTDYYSKLNVDVSVDPCTDFYEFACGPQERNLSTSFEHFYTVQGLTILGLLKPENSAEEKAQNFYKSCVEAAAHLESMAFNEELDKVLEKLEKIPHGNLQEKLELLQNEYGLSPFFAWGVIQDIKDTDKNLIQITQKESTVFGEDDPGKMEQFTRLLNESAHYKTMMAGILGNQLNFTGKSNDFEQLLNLDMEIRGLMQPPLSHEIDTLNRYNLMNLTQLQNLAGFINWKKFFNSGFQNLNMTIHDAEEIVVICPQFLSKLSKKLEVLQNSPDGAKLLNKYLIFEAGRELFGEIFISTSLSSQVILENSTLTPVGMTTCSAITQQRFDHAVASMHRHYLLNQYPDLETKSMETVREMAENIRDELILVLKKADWLDEKSRESAIEKAREIRVLIGFPDGVKNSTLLEQVYEFCPKMNELDFLGNLINYTKAARETNSKMLRTLVDKNDSIIWLSLGAQPLENNAFTFTKLGIIFLPIRNLLPPNFSPGFPESFPESASYGKIGVRIGHEFLHGFNKFGSTSDGDVKFLSQNPNPNPNLSLNQSQNFWETEETKEELENRSSCLVRQYSKFSYPDGKSLNGTQTLEENFADIGGLDVATRAFFRLLEKNYENLSNKSSGGKYEKEETADQFSDEQLFFVSFAKGWCTHEPPAFSKDSHSPNKFRVLGALQNSKEFSRAFKCPLNSPMDPQEKCSVF